MAPRRCLQCKCLPWRPVDVPAAKALDPLAMPVLPSPPYRMSCESEHKLGTSTPLPSVPELETKLGPANLELSVSASLQHGVPELETKPGPVSVEHGVPVPGVAFCVHVSVSLFFSMVIVASLAFETTAPTPAACAADDTACRAAAAAILVATVLSLWTATPLAFNLVLDNHYEKTLLYAGIMAACQFFAVGNELVVVVHVMSATGRALGGACLGAAALVASGVCVYAMRRNPRAYRLSAGTAFVGSCAVVGVTLGSVHVLYFSVPLVLAIVAGMGNAYVHREATRGMLSTGAAEDARDTSSMLLLSVMLCKIILARGFFCNGVYNAMEAMQSVAAFAMIATVVAHTA